jgi:prepilin-type N-terminal cleavage/methylation domain-containing protein
MKRTAAAVSPLRGSTGNTAGFTMVEIAICLAIIGIALVGIIGVLPIGLNTQRATREETVINQDVAVLLPIIKQGSTGADDLTNYVYAITNNWTLYNSDGSINKAGQNGYSGYVDGNAPNVFISPNAPSGSPYSSTFITNGANIIGLLSTPEFTYPNGVPAANLYEMSGYSNHITAYVRSMSGLAAEKPPQNNNILVSDAFAYQIVIVNAPVALETNNFNFNTPYNKQLWQNQRELRMTYYWPQLPNGKTGAFRQTFRRTIAGQLGTNFLNGQFLYFYQPQTFGLNPN